MSEKKRNALIGQSGGPTAAINATLSGIVRELTAQGTAGTVYGTLYGISGVIDDRIIEIGSRLSTEEDFRLLECTPSSALGSCRLKLPPVEETGVYEKIFATFEKYDIGYFLLIGGNDSMDTVDKLSRYAKAHGKDVTVIGVSKTIDNDLVVADHTPGYGSAAKYIATVCEEICGDCAIYTTKAVTVVEIMGRDAGWLTAAAALPRLYGLPCPDLVYLPEVAFSETDFLAQVRRLLAEKPNVVVAVSEGIHDENGEYTGSATKNGATDVFGHKYLAGAGKYLENLVKETLGCKVRSVELNLPQRCAGHCLSATDIEESVRVGREAARAAAAGKTGGFAILRRADGPAYATVTDTVEVALVANKIKKVPLEYITEDKANVTDALLAYLAPIIAGEVDVPKKDGLPLRFTF